MVDAVVLPATGVDGDGHREVLGMRVATAETGGGVDELFADLVPRGPGGVRPVTSDAPRAWSRRSQPTCPARRGSGAAPPAPRTW